ncbi:MAG TPA: hypothetical protein VFY29_20360 [Terriglobia bacterium]|nr:hypothetical protein [Terriglobia bacterium]
MRHFYRQGYAAAAGLLIALAAALCLAQSARPAGNLPAQLSDDAFWKLVVDFSAPGGSFPFENFMSNEDGFQTVIPELKKTVRPGSVYLGVGPEQNFTYISALRPGMAFIIDIRRQNMLEHLLYKSLFEMSPDRVQFISRLFSRPAPAGLAAGATAESLFRAFEKAAADRKLYDASLQEVYDRLTKTHKFSLSTEDRQGIAKVYSAFFEGGPRMDYRFNNNGGPAPSQGATYTELMTATDREGRNWSYLETEENFRVVQEYERKNLIIPLVDDFAGEKSIRAIAKYVKDRNEVVGVFYTSNVDQYLFQDRVEDLFYANVGTLPIDASSAFIRTINTSGRSGRNVADVQATAGNQWAVLLCPIADVLKAANAGEILSQRDVNRMSH